MMYPVRHVPVQVAWRQTAPQVQQQYVSSGCAPDNITCLEIYINNTLSNSNSSVNSALLPLVDQLSLQSLPKSAGDIVGEPA